MGGAALAAACKAISLLSSSGESSPTSERLQMDGRYVVRANLQSLLVMLFYLMCRIPFGTTCHSTMHSKKWKGQMAGMERKATFGKLMLSERMQ